MLESSAIHKALNKYWGYTSFREKQEEIIQSVLKGKDTLALLPTGGGKSICFQIPALVQEGLCLVVSPLIALMQDQVDQLQKKGIKALLVNSGMSKREIDIALDNVVYGDYKFLYLSPERIETDLFQARLKKMNINLIAIDEAHCISQWGYDFRPAYLNLAQLREQLPDVPMLALTATATHRVIDDIQDRLAFIEKHLIKKSFYRKNLAYVVLHEEDKEKRLLKVINGVGGSGIIYTNSRRKTKETADFLQKKGISSSFYHGGLGYKERDKIQKDWINNQIQVIVATNAFGMGIDKPDVRFVVHLDLPDSLEAYFQEAGRAGRDRRKAYGVILNSPAMKSDLKKRVEQNFPKIASIKKTYLALCNFLQIPIDSGKGQSFLFDIQSFSSRYNLSINECYHCIGFLEKEGYIALSEELKSTSKLKLVVSKENLYKFQIAHQPYEVFIKTLLRTYGGLFENYVPINEFVIAKNLNIELPALMKILKRLNNLDIIHYIEKSKLPKLTFLSSRIEQSELRISKENYQDRKKIAFEKLKKVIYYIESKDQCRSQLLLEYFEETDSPKCGLCDYCLSLKQSEISDQEFDTIKTRLQNLLRIQAHDLSGIMNEIQDYNDKKIVAVISFLLESGQIKTNGSIYEWK